MANEYLVHCQCSFCGEEINNGQLIYRESYYGSTYCSQKHLILDAMQRYDWTIGTVSNKNEDEDYWGDMVDIQELTESDLDG